jgi:hypothetical protein
MRTNFAVIISIETTSLGGQNLDLYLNVLELLLQHLELLVQLLPLLFLSSVLDHLLTTATGFESATGYGTERDA